MKNRIREIRKQRSLTLHALAELVGTTGQQIHNLELGKRGLDTKWMERIAKALNIGLADLIIENASQSTIGSVATIPLTGFIRKEGIVELIKEQECSAQKVPLSSGLETAETVYFSQDPYLFDGFYIFIEKEIPGVPSEFIGKICLIKTEDKICIKKLYPGSKPGYYNLHEQNSSLLPEKDVLVLASGLMIGTSLKRD